MPIFPFIHNLAILLFSEIVIFMRNWYNTSCRPIKSVSILVISKLDSRCAVVRFLAWLQTELDSTQSCYHYKVTSKALITKQSLHTTATLAGSHSKQSLRPECELSRTDQTRACHRCPQWHKAARRISTSHLDGILVYYKATPARNSLVPIFTSG